MRLLPTAFTSALAGAAVITLALSVTSAPVQAALYRDPLTKDTVAFVPTIKHPGANDYSRIKLDITPLKGETIKRYGHEIAAEYDVKVVYKKKVLLHRHLGYWRTLAATAAAQRKVEVKSDAFVAGIRKAAGLSPTEAKIAAQAAVKRELHAQLKSDVRNTVTNVFTALAQQVEASSSTDSNSSFDLRPILDNPDAYTVLSSSAAHGYGKQATIQISKISGLGDDNTEGLYILGHLAGDGYTYTFNATEGTFKANYQK